jgi:yeast amino acid transporter
MIGLFPVLYIGWKLLKKTRLNMPHEVDLHHNLDEVDAYERTFVPIPPK